THLEIESLPTSGFWGYLHYPIGARHARTYDLDYLGMTGRFHRSWADFGGLKTTDQLAHECGTILSAGGKISVGDQLHPNGALDPAVYRLLGRVFERVEQLEPWLEGSVPAAEVGILSIATTEENRPFGEKIYRPGVEGAAQMLLESAVQFDIVDDENLDRDLGRYRALILPDDTPVIDQRRYRLEAYMAEGGKLVLSGTAALDPQAGNFVLSAMPVRYRAPCPTMPGYMRLDAALTGESELATDYDYVLYGQAQQVEPVAGAARHGQLRRALFNRTWEHFISHAHAPVGDYLNSPLVAANDQILYMAAPLFGAYRRFDYWAYRAIAINALRDFLPSPLVQTSAPGWIETTLHSQQADGATRRIIHLTAYQPRRTLQPVPHVDQAAKTAGIVVSVRVDGAMPRRVYLAPERQVLPFTVENGYVRVELPPIGVHTVIVLE
ncbi:MAG TPA: hypothetical protein VMT34_14160, partial [Aggregatilineales bacterium]|nr:hypothetical protein [Aggregatilineales bacterium]